MDKEMNGDEYNLKYPGIDRILVVQLFVDALIRHLKEPQVMVETTIDESTHRIALREVEAIFEIVTADIQKALGEHEKD
jgi:hypothetical protein